MSTQGAEQIFLARYIIETHGFTAVVLLRVPRNSANCSGLYISLRIAPRNLGARYRASIHPRAYARGALLVNIDPLDFLCPRNFVASLGDYAIVKHCHILAAVPTHFVCIENPLCHKNPQFIISHRGKQDIGQYLFTNSSEILRSVSAPLLASPFRDILRFPGRAYRISFLD